MKDLNLTKTGDGIFFAFTDHSKIENVYTSYNHEGIYLAYSNHNCIRDSRVVNNRYYGINMKWSSGNKVINNKISHTQALDGLVLDHSSNNIITLNNITDNNHHGIFLVNSKYNLFTYNKVANNEAGIHIYAWIGFSDVANQSYTTVLYHNNTSIQALSSASDGGPIENMWDNGYPSGGNYWSDYVGVDLCNGPYQNMTGSDGIGDTPYVINQNNQDNYPLMGMFSDFNVTWQEETYHVNVVSNSTVSNFKFEVLFILETGKSFREIHFNVAGEDGTSGFCRICIPTALMNDAYTVFVNDTEVSHTLLPCSNRTHSYLYFTYDHSTQEVIIVPEFPTWASLLLALIVLTFIIVVYKRRLPKTLRDYSVAPRIRARRAILMTMPFQTC